MAKRITINLSDDLGEVEALLRKRRRYRSHSEYFQALLRYDAQTMKEHLLTAEWAALSPAERDMLDAALLRQVKSGEGIRGSWLETRIEVIVKRCLAEKGAAPTAREVASELAKEIAPP